MSNRAFFSGRTRARRYALQGLYSWALSSNPLAQVEADVLSDHQKGHLDADYFHQLLFEVPKHLSELEALFSPHLSRKLHELDIIELTLLRIAVYELNYCPEVPYKVIVNEALELAKIFGSTDSYKFINGVLDKVCKEARPNE